MGFTGILVVLGAIAGGFLMAGGKLGVLIQPSEFVEMPVRLSAGAIFAYAPATKSGALTLCADLQLTNYFAGDAIDPGHTLTEVQLVLGIGFDLSHGSK